MASLSFRKRLIIILYILSFTISIVIFSYVMGRVAIDVDYTSYRQYAVDGNTIYYVQNHRDEGFLFAMTSSGRVKRVFSSRSISKGRILGVSAYDKNVYIVLEHYLEDKSKDDTNEEDSSPIYQILCLDDKFNVLTRTPKFTMPNDQFLKGFSAEGTGLFMTFVSEDGSNVRVYALSQTDLMSEESANSAKELSIESVRSKRADTTRFYADAIYSRGQLYVRTDADAPSGIFAADEYLKNVVAKMRLNILQILQIYSQYLIWYVAAVAIWFILLNLIIRALEEKNRSLYYLLIAETVLAVIVAAAVITVSVNYQNARYVEHSRFGAISLMGLLGDAGLTETIDYSDASFYDSERYQQIRNSLTSFVRREGNKDIFYDVLVVRLRDNIVCASSSGRNKEVITDIYGGSFSEIPDDIARGNRFVVEDFTSDGQNYSAVAVANAALSADYALLGIINVTSVDPSVFVDNAGVFLVILLVFAIASALVVFIWFLHMRDLGAIEEALSNTAVGNPIPERPAFLGRDIKDMWDSIAEIHKRIEEIQYAKLRILEAYYRFAPKNVEKILDKKSIVEVKNGDNRDLSASIGTISFDVVGGRRFNKMDNLMAVIGEYQKEHESIIISKSADMSMLQILFLENVKDTIKAFIDIYGRVTRSEDAVSFSVLLLYENGKFGVAGNEDETSIYYYTQNKELIRSISSFIIEKKLRLIISEAILTREGFKGTVRFIGYGGINSKGELVKLYEVLDVCPVRERTIKMNTLFRFNEALELFYEKDFYLARTKFSEILKELPDDMLVKWYVFESDRYLNEGTDGDAYKLLHN